MVEPGGTWDPARFAKVAVVQWAPEQPAPLGITREEAERFKAGNRAVLEGYAREAAARGAEWVVVPEFAVLGYPDIPELPPEDDEYRNRADLEPYVETVPGPTTGFFGALARELGVWIQVGFAEVNRATDAYHNVAVVMDPRGQVAASYRKQNLFALEHQFLVAGTRNVVFEGPFGRVGLLICADVYSERVLSGYLRSRVDVLSLSTSWAQWNTGMETFRRAARRVGAHLLAANQNYFPDSGVINPDGSLQSHIRQTTGLAYGYLPRVSRR